MYMHIWIRNNDNGQRTKHDTLRELQLNEVNQEQAFVTRLGTCSIYFSQSMFMPGKVGRFYQPRRFLQVPGHHRIGRDIPRKLFSVHYGPLSFKYTYYD